MEETDNTQKNINFSDSVWAYIAEEIEKKPTIANAKDLARSFVCAATFITTDNQGNDLFNNRQFMDRNADTICDVIDDPQLRQAFITETQDDYLFQQGLHCQKMPQNETEQELIEVIESYRELS